MSTPRRRRERKIPWQQLSVLAICRFAEPLATTSLLPYLPEMVESFGVAQNEVGKWAGLLAAAFSIAQAMMGIPWGRFSDIYGRKPAILLGLTSTMCTSMLLGFSVNLPMAFFARALAGAGNGNVGILRTTVAEMVPFKELQPRAFSIMPLVWTIGSIFGPMLGGLLANPFNVKPGDKRTYSNVFESFPYLLPNLVSAAFFTFSITVGLLFIEETLATRRLHRDYGLLVGDKIISFAKTSIQKLRNRFRQSGIPQTVGETEPLLKPSAADEESSMPSPQAKKKSSRPAPSLREIMNKQSFITLVAYTILALHSLAYDQILPVYMQQPPIGDADTTPFTPPLQFAGGIGLDHFSIGLMSTVYGIVGMFIQFLIFPPLTRKYGALFWFKVVSVMAPFVYLATPFTAVLPSRRLRVIWLLVVMFVKSWCVIFAFPCSIILLTNSANSLRVLGTLNGFATTMAAVGRAAGPASAGALFTLGMKRGYIIAPFWFLAAVGALGAIVVFFIVEGEGFEAEEDENEEQSNENNGVQAEDGSGDPSVAPTGGEVQASGHPAQPFSRTTEVDVDGQAELSGGGRVTPPYESTASTVIDSDDEEEGGLLGNGSRRVAQSSRRQEASTDPSTEPPRQVKRQTSFPIGTGEQGISRKYSTNLGQGLGGQGSFSES